MTHIRAYLTFNGNCREAMTFYQHCFGGDLTFQPVRESPMADKLPPEMSDCMLHASLTTESIVLMGTDMVCESGLLKGNSVSLLLDCNNEEELRRYYNNLLTDGNPTQPLEITFWGALFGGLTDRYGHHWLFHFQQTI